MSLNIKYLVDNNDKQLSSKLYDEKYNKEELVKAIDIELDELISNNKSKNLDLILKSLFDEQILLNKNAKQQIRTIENNVILINQKIQTYRNIVNSLNIENDNLKINEARYDNYIDSLQNIITDLRDNSNVVLSKLIIEKTEKSQIEAENQGLLAQKNALIKQINTLNNLLAQAQRNIQKSQEKLSAKELTGGASSGTLASIIFDSGDVTKNKSQAMVVMDLNGGPNFKQFNKPKNLYIPAGAKQDYPFAEWFEITANNEKAITVESIQYSGDIFRNPFNYYETFPLVIEKNQTKRFDITKPSQYFLGLKGWIKPNLFRLDFKGEPSQYRFSMKVSISSGDLKETLPEITFLINNYTE